MVTRTKEAKPRKAEQPAPSLFRDEQEETGAIYDDSEREYKLSLSPKVALTDAEAKDAAMLALPSLAFTTILVEGGAGSGKDAWGHIRPWKYKTYFNRPVFLDKPPRRLFGDYTLFNEERLLKELAKCQFLSKGTIPEPKTAKDKEYLEKLTETWWEERGKLFLQGSVQVYTEFWRYLPRRNPNSRMGKLIGGLLKVRRHYGMLIIGLCQTHEDLDRKTCLPHIKYVVTPNINQATGVLRYTLQGVSYSPLRDRLEPITRPLVRKIDCAKPQWRLGGKCYFDLWNTYNVQDFGLFGSRGVEQ